LAQTCLHIQTEEITSQSEKYCGITQNQYQSENMTLSKFKDIDLNKNCTLDSANREGCLLKKHQIQSQCRQDSSPTTTVHGVECRKAHIVQCVGDNPNPIEFDELDGFTSESLNIDKVLKTEGQEGFQNISDQGAGTNNPAINFLLYIINTLANLSFLISVFMLIMAGFYTVIASGNSEKSAQAKAAVKYFIIAVSFTLLSYSIVTIIKALLYS